MKAKIKYFSKNFSKNKNYKNLKLYLIKFQIYFIKPAKTIEI